MVSMLFTKSPWQPGSETEHELEKSQGGFFFPLTTVYGGEKVL